MAWELPLQCITLKAAGDLSAKQFYFVKLTANNTVNVCTAATDVPIGVLQNNPTAGHDAQVMVCGVSKVVVNASSAINPGDLVGTDANGKAVKKTPGTDVTHYVVGQCIEGSGSAGAIGVIFLNGVPFRAA